MASGFVSGFRIVQPRWAARAMDGEGARLYGGRWNSVGVPMVYLAGSRSLAALEMLAHLTPESRRLRFSLIEVSFSTKLVEVIASDQLVANWRDEPAPDALKRVGADWLQSSRSAVLCVPSTVVPQETNYLLNPRHANFKKVTVGEPMEWQLDQRS